MGTSFFPFVTIHAFHRRTGLSNTVHALHYMQSHGKNVHIYDENVLAYFFLDTVYIQGEHKK